MTLDLSARRALVRDALKTDTGIEAFRAALDGANEDDRAALARTLPPSRLFTSEGPTPRACFVLTALGKPKLVAETLVPPDPRLNDKYAVHHGSMVTAVIDAAAGREPQWRAEFVDRFALFAWWGAGLVWPVCRTLVHDYAVPPTSRTYLRSFVRELVAIGGNEQPDKARGQVIMEYLVAHPELVECEFWAFFRVEGMGDDYLLTDWWASAWNAALEALCAVDPAFRSRLIIHSLDALLRDFPAKAITWYLRVHRMADPTPDEVAAWQDRYIAVLATTPSTAVGLAQDMLLRAVKAGCVDVNALIEASNAVFMRTEKKLVRAQLGLLGALKSDESQRCAISDLVASVIDTLPPDLAQIAAKLTTDAGEVTRTAPPPVAGNPVAIPAPRRTPAPPSSTPLVTAAQAELPDLIAEQLEGTGDGADLPRILAGLGASSVMLSPALAERAEEIINAVWDEDNASPRRQLAARILSGGQGRGRSKLGRLVGQLGRRPQEDGQAVGSATVSAVRFRGYRRYVIVGLGEADPAGAAMSDHTWTTSTHNHETGEWEVTKTTHSRSGFLHIPTHSPAALLAEQFIGKPVTVPLPAATRQWERVLRPPGAGVYSSSGATIGKDPKALWITPAEPPLTDQASFAERALDVAPVAEEFSYRVTASREQDGYDQLVQWAAWLLQDNLDTLAAHEHPALYAATQVVNVRGVAPLLTALGGGREVPSVPVYSALALASSAKEATHRAQAAEAVARLADSGLLDPESFATELVAHLSDKFAMAGRLAQTFTDAASISAISGYRVLQTLAALLPHLTGVTGAGKLVELTARLSADYGTPVPVPATLASKSKGSSALAVSLRALDAVVGHPTPLAQEAAAQASEALAEHR